MPDTDIKQSPVLSAVVGVVIGVVAFNLLIYLAGRAIGGTFRYMQSGQLTRVDVVAVSVMSAIPLTIGLALTAWLSRPWPGVITTAKVVAPVLAVATIWVMTIPAHFDTTSTWCLAAMHLAPAMATVLTGDRLRRQAPAAVYASRLVPVSTLWSRRRPAAFRARGPVE